MSHKFDLALALLVITAIGLIDYFLIKESRPDPRSMVWVEAGFHQVGSDGGMAKKDPANPIALHGFWIDEEEVSQADYQHFAADTGHVIIAEQGAAKVIFSATDKPGRLSPIQDANWHRLRGSEDEINTQAQHPAIHVTYKDAQAYCKWLNKDLPTATQFEFAATGEREDEKYIWKTEPLHRSGFRCVTNQTAWQRLFE